MVIGASLADLGEMPPAGPAGSATSESGAAKPILSIVVPAYNEAGGIAEFNRRLTNVRVQLSESSEVVYVNDGSRDGTLEILRGLQERDPSITIINLSRNFGKEIALIAGLDHAGGDAVIVIDADLQDPPEVIPSLIKPWREDATDVVCAQRRSRAGESRLKKVTSYGFYRVMNAVSAQPIPVDTGDFRLLSRRAVDALKLLREQHRFTKGLFTWIGYRQVVVTYERDRRLSGNSKWNYWKLWNLSLEGITSFSIAPLQAATYFGFTTAVVSVLYAIYMISRTIIYGNPVAGYPSLLVIILFLGGVQLLSLGIIGEYVGRIFDETKQRPLYLVDSIISDKAKQTASLLSRNGSSDTNCAAERQSNPGISVRRDFMP